MTNHPRSQRPPKFRVGQVVIIKQERIAEKVKSSSFVDDEWNYEVSRVRFRWEHELRRLTKKEAGR